jgi:hypothetical protein
MPEPIPGRNRDQICHFRLVDDADAAAANQFFDAIDEKTVGGDCHIVRLEYGAEFTRFFEVEQDPAVARRGQEDGAQFFQQREVRMVQRNFDP